MIEKLYWIMTEVNTLPWILGTKYGNASMIFRVAGSYGRR